MLANSLSPCIITTKVEESRDFCVKHFGAKIKLRRHIKLSSAEDISGKHIREYLALALKASSKP